MDKKLIYHFVCLGALFIFLIVLSGCGTSHVPDQKNSSITGKNFTIITKSAGNENMKKMTDGFREVIEEKGGNVIVKEPSFATNDQTELVSSLMSQKISSISIAVNDPTTLKQVLQEAMNKDIKVTAFDSPADKDSRNILVNQATSEEIGEALVEAVYDLTDGSGQWAILSTTSVSPNQNAWIDAIKRKLESDSKYGGMYLVDIAYGNDDPEKSREETLRLLDEYPDLKVICSPTTIGILAAAKVLSQKQSNVKVTGLGMPSEMSEYMGNVCPYMFFWDTVALGKLTAYTSIALVEGAITGAVGETFEAGDMGNFTITKSEDGGSEVVLGPLMRIE